MNYDIAYSSSAIEKNANLGTIEADASGFYGAFENEEVRGYKILEKFLQFDFKTVLDVGAGALNHSDKFIKNGRIVDAVDIGESVYYNAENNTGIRNLFIGDFNSIEIPHMYDAIWCSHILEHQLNVNYFLKKINRLLIEGGYLSIVVPPRKPYIVGGHLSLWNAGLLIYNLILAGFDCSEDCRILQYDYNIGLILKKRTIKELPYNLTMDKGDLEKLREFFPFDVTHGFNGDIIKLNWD
jgi:SAM-dependent methyltransferase